MSLPPYFRKNIARARNHLRGHVLLHEYDALDQQTQFDLAEAADKLVDDVATSTQERVFLLGAQEENVVWTNAIYGNGLCMLIRVNARSLKKDS